MKLREGFFLRKGWVGGRGDKWKMGENMIKVIYIYIYIMKLSKNF